MPVRDPNHDPLAVNAVLLDPGPFSTEVRPLGNAGSFHAGRRLESIRLGEYVVSPAQVEPSLLKGSVGYPDASGPLTEQAKRLIEYFHQSEVAEAVDLNDVVAGFGFKNEVKESYSYSGGAAVLRFNTPEAAQRNADALVAAAKTDTKGTDPRMAAIPGHPETSAVMVNREFGRGNTFLTAVTVRGDLLLLQSVNGRDPELDSLASSFGTGEALVGRILDRQIPLLEKYHPTPVADYANLPEDPTGLLAHTVPFNRDTSAYETRKEGTYGPQSALAYQGDPLAIAEAFESSGTTSVLIRRTRIFLTRDSASATELAEALAAQAQGDNRTFDGGIDGFPTARCYQASDGKTPRDLTSNYCQSVAGKYVIDVFDDGDARRIRQLLSAQFLLLPQG
ncbi:DUF7373 family lipoprotein [Mycolicibacterium brumae]|uniref:DUF7373 family lipoprotein n=1 Tax=Mycolicibacterium brumae TaxID=85968 RepID=UPI000FE183E4|nr:hypothetical protein [Mycolicibacterium brumae]MCV7192667.1 hypothetical protein [Mycolicibacterium brumae]UWW08818.1 hypothetical protein L2Z93_001889 [Mycolicibacterium brumae]